MISELDLVVLARDLGVHGLKAGDIGTVVHGYADGEGYEVEFLNGDGQTVAVCTLDRSDVRPMCQTEILSVRPLLSIAA